MRIAALSRGGLAAYGAHYDPHRNEVEVEIRDGDVVPVTIEYPSAPTLPTLSVSGVTASTPVISGNKITLNLSAIRDGGRCDVTVVLGSASRVIRIRGRSQTQVERYDCWPDFVGP